jgi:hypothetical protein
MEFGLWVALLLVTVAFGLSVWTVVLVRQLEQENARLTEFIEWYVNAKEKYEYMARRETYYGDGDK